jgi:uncharacterized protein (TIGR02246 family)
MDDIDRAAIRQACSDLVLNAVACMDFQHPGGLAELFTEDGVLVRPNGQLLQGRDAIRLAYEQRPADRITRHLVTNTRVEVDSAREAHALSYVLLWGGSTADATGPQGRGARGAQVLGEFDDRFVLTAQGWRIARREARFVLHAGG